MPMRGGCSGRSQISRAMTTSDDANRWIPTLTVAVAVLGCAVYLPALRAQFTFDDTYIIVDNPMVTGGATLGDIFTSHYWAGEDARGNLYRPLVVLSYRLNFLLAGLNPWSYHLVNLVLHGLISGMVLHLARRLTGSWGAATATAILFATHPIHSEAVVSAVGRAELMAAVCVVAGWLWRDRRALSLALFVCGLFCKENAVVLPALLVIEDMMRGRLRRTLRSLAPYLIVTGLFLAGRLVFLDPSAGDPHGPFVGVPAAHRILTALDVFGRYLRLLVWPVGLSADYSFDQIPTVTSLLAPGVAIGVIAGVALLAAGWLARTSRPAILTGVLVFLAALAPVSNIVIVIGVVMAERLLYLPSLGLCLCAGVLLASLARLAGPGRQLVAGCLLVSVSVSIYTVLSWRRALDWRSPLSLFEATVRTSPRSALAHFGLASAYQGLGRTDQAEAAFLASAEIAPHRAGTWFNLGTLYEATARTSDAIEAYERAVRNDPGYQLALNNLGILYQAEGRLDEAEALYRRAVESGVKSAGPAYNLGTILEATGRGGESIAWYRQAIEADPSHVMSLNNLGRQLIIAVRPGEAVPYLERAVAIEPEGELPRINLAVALYETGELERAEALASAVLEKDPLFAPAETLLEKIRSRKLP